MKNAIIKEYCSNQLMQDMFSTSKEASRFETLRMKVSVWREVLGFFRNVREQDCFVVCKGYSETIEDFPDSIAYESYCNEMSFSSVKRYGCFDRTVKYILDTIIMRLLQFEGREFCICVSFDEDSDRITVHFHTYNNKLMFSDIGKFDQPVLYTIIKT